MKYINLNMDRVQYEGHDYQSYSLPADRVNAVLNTENVPEITLKEDLVEEPAQEVEAPATEPVAENTAE